MLFVARNKNCALTFKERIENSNSPLSAYHEAMQVVARSKNCALIFKERIENSPFKSLRPRKDLEFVYKSFGRERQRNVSKWKPHVRVVLKENCTSGACGLEICMCTACKSCRNQSFGSSSIQICCPLLLFFICVDRESENVKYWQVPFEAISFKDSIREP